MHGRNLARIHRGNPGQPGLQVALADDQLRRRKAIDQRRRVGRDDELRPRRSSPQQINEPVEDVRVQPVIDLLDARQERWVRIMEHRKQRERAHRAERCMRERRGSHQAIVDDLDRDRFVRSADRPKPQLLQSRHDLACVGAELLEDIRRVALQPRQERSEVPCIRPERARSGHLGRCSRSTGIDVEHTECREQLLDLAHLGTAAIGSKLRHQCQPERLLADLKLKLLPGIISEMQLVVLERDATPRPGGSLEAEPFAAPDSARLFEWRYRKRVLVRCAGRRV